jgi:hypothetical protein
MGIPECFVFIDTPKIRVYSFKSQKDREKYIYLSYEKSSPVMIFLTVMFLVKFISKSQRNSAQNFS